MKFYTASKNRNPGRDSWSVIFRHPGRFDAASGKGGRRVRRGLGTADETVADNLVQELNEILSTPTLWEPAARAIASSRYDPRVVEIFYEGLEAARTDFRAVREEILPLPGHGDGYRHVLLLGTTGAGKTTVVRQILGTDPGTERFPSTSTAKTTVADTELVITADGSHQAAVTFVQRDEVIDYLAENVSEAALACFNGKSDARVARRLLDHVNQRFRFSYVLGRTPMDDDAEDVVDDDDLVEDDHLIDGEYDGEVDLDATADLIRDVVRSLRELVRREEQTIRATLETSDEDRRVVDEVIEDFLDTELRQSEEFHQIVDRLIDEIEKRFTLLQVGELRRNRQGWPTSWSWSTDDRAEFIRTVSRFSSNYAPSFGRLLTPLVNGIRVAGPFQPAWALEAPRLVLIDTEGLGHTPNSAATLSTHVAKLVEEVDAVLLVDNATQPMQAAPVAALKGVAVAGNGMKLHFLFTHFDQVKGDNLPTFTAREEHVLASAENVLKAIGDELGPAAERILRRRLDEACSFVGGIDETLDPKKKSGNRSIRQLNELLELLAKPELEGAIGLSRPVFDRMNLSLAVAEAAKSFHGKWRGLLGLDVNPAAPKEHWTRIKALSRRLAEGWADEYDMLRPVADLRFELQRQVYLMLQRPLRWDGGVPSDDERQTIVDEISNAITKKLMELTRRRIMDDAQLAWQEAYGQRGTGSTFVRARIIAADVYARRAPVPTVTASPDQNRFLKDVAACIDEVAQESELITLE
jgi:hypothetical protein